MTPPGTLPDAGSLAAAGVAGGDLEAVELAAAAGAHGVVYLAPDRSLAGWGVAARLPLPRGLDDAARRAEVVRWLASVAGDADQPVVALGALPFDAAAPAELVVPRVTVGVADGRRWATVVGDRGTVTPDAVRRAVAEIAAAAPQGGAPAGSDGRPPLTADPGRYTKAVDRALEAIARREVEKVVLSRTVEIGAPPPFTPDEVVRRLHRQEPGCTAFAVPVGDGVFVGASPELLVERAGAHVRSLPLAGTAALTGDGARDDEIERRLLASAKDRREHGPVVAAIREALGARCEALTVDTEPVAARLGSVVHLATSVRGTLRDRRADTVLELLAALHPTPAVGGAPREAALELIARLEPEGRGRWAGPVGYVDHRGDGQWVIGIRSALVGKSGTRLLAGAGIVEGSEPEAELDETTVKLRPVLEALYPDAEELLNGSR